MITFAPKKGGGQVTLPSHIVPAVNGRKHPTEHLAYINDAEAHMLKMMTDGRSNTTKFGPQSFISESAADHAYSGGADSRGSPASQASVGAHTTGSGGGYGVGGGGGSLGGGGSVGSQHSSVSASAADGMVSRGEVGNGVGSSHSLGGGIASGAQNVGTALSGPFGPSSGGGGLARSAGGVANIVGGNGGQLGALGNNSTLASLAGALFGNATGAGMNLGRMSASDVPNVPTNPSYLASQYSQYQQPPGYVAPAGMSSGASTMAMNNPGDWGPLGGSSTAAQNNWGNTGGGLGSLTAAGLLSSNDYGMNNSANGVWGNPKAGYSTAYKSDDSGYGPFAGSSVAYRNQPDQVVAQNGQVAYMTPNSQYPQAVAPTAAMMAGDFGMTNPNPLLSKRAYNPATAPQIAPASDPSPYDFSQSYGPETPMTGLGSIADGLTGDPYGSTLSVTPTGGMVPNIMSYNPVSEIAGQIPGLTAAYNASKAAQRAAAANGGTDIYGNPLGLSYAPSQFDGNLYGDNDPTVSLPWNAGTALTDYFSSKLGRPLMPASTAQSMNAMLNGPGMVGSEHADNSVRVVVNDPATGQPTVVMVPTTPTGTPWYYPQYTSTWDPYLPSGLLGGYIMPTKTYDSSLGKNPKQGNEA